MDPTIKCIWCSQSDPRPAVEHIIPEALGCHPDFTLDKGQVCTSCNNKLGHLDRAVIDDFDIPLLMHNVPRKRGRRPTLASRGNVAGWVSGTETHIRFNMDPQAVEEDGQSIGAYHGRRRDIRPSWSVTGDRGTVSFRTSIGESPKFARGIYKIALSGIAFYMGPLTAADSRLDWIRRFVLHGRGTPRIILHSADTVENRVSVCAGDNGVPAWVLVRLWGADFLAHMESEPPGFDDALQHLCHNQGTAGWSTIPPSLSAGLQEPGPPMTTP